MDQAELWSTHNTESWLKSGSRPGNTAQRSMEGVKVETAESWVKTIPRATEWLSFECNADSTKVTKVTCSICQKYEREVKGARQLNAGFVKGIHGSAIKKDSVIKHSKTEQHLRALKMFPELVEGYQVIKVDEGQGDAPSPENNDDDYVEAPQPVDLATPNQSKPTPVAPPPQPPPRHTPSSTVYKPIAPSTSAPTPLRLQLQQTRPTPPPPPSRPTLQAPPVSRPNAPPSQAFSGSVLGNLTNLPNLGLTNSSPSVGVSGPSGSSGSTCADLLKAQQRFMDLMDDVPGDVIPSFVIWLDVKLSEYKVFGNLNKEEGFSVKMPTWISLAVSKQLQPLLNGAALSFAAFNKLAAAAVNPSMNLSGNQSITPSVNQSMNPSVNQSMNPSVNQSMNPSVNQSMNPSVNQSMAPNQSMNTVNQSMNQSHNHTMNQSLSQMNQSAGTSSAINLTSSHTSQLNTSSSTQGVAGRVETNGLRQPIDYRPYSRVRPDSELFDEPSRKRRKPLPRRLTPTDAPMDLSSSAKRPVDVDSAREVSYDTALLLSGRANSKPEDSATADEVQIMRHQGSARRKSSPKYKPLLARVEGLDSDDTQRTSPVVSSSVFPPGPASSQYSEFYLDGDCEARKEGDPDEVQDLSMSNGSKPPDQLQCSDCEQRFVKAAELRLHLTALHNHHGFSSLSNDLHRCCFCSEEFSSAQEALIHVNGQHVTDRFTCPQCSAEGRNIGFSCKEYLRQHITGMHGPPKYSCRDCGERFRWTSQLATHRKKCCNSSDDRDEELTGECDVIPEENVIPDEHNETEDIKDVVLIHEQSDSKCADYATDDNKPFAIKEVTTDVSQSDDKPVSDDVTCVTSDNTQGKLLNEETIFDESKTLDPATGHFETLAEETVDDANPGPSSVRQEVDSPVEETNQAGGSLQVESNSSEESVSQAKDTPAEEAEGSSQVNERPNPGSDDGEKPNPGSDDGDDTPPASPQ